MAEKVERIVDTTVEKADSMKVQTAEVLEEAARRLRDADLSVKGEDIKAVLNDVEARINQLRTDIEKKVEPVENFIVEHPFASIMIAAGVGFMVASLASRMRARD